jgi:hypothetical protein
MEYEAKIYKITTYIVDPNGTYRDADELYHEMINNTEAFAPCPIDCAEREFEWDDNPVINNIGCTREAYNPFAV